MDEATTPEGRRRLTHDLCRTLHALVGAGVCLVCSPDTSKAQPAREEPFATAGVADALEGVAASLAEAAGHASHLATHARVIAPPHRKLA